MLVSERDLDESDGVLLLGAEGSPGRHIAAAFMKLGKRTLLQLEEKSPLQILAPLNAEVIRSKEEIPELSEVLSVKRAFNSVLIAPHENLSSARVLSEAEILRYSKLLTDLDRDLPTARKWFFLSQYESEETLDRLLAVSPHCGFILCPIVLGFRDHGIFDELFVLPREQQVLRLDTSSLESWEFCFASDVAGLAVSAARKELPTNRVIRMKPNLAGLETLLKSFQDAMPEYRPSTLKKLLAKGRKVGQKLPRSESPSRIPVERLRALQLSDELFPTFPTRPERFFLQSKESWQRNPDMDLHFTPARAI